MWITGSKAVFSPSGGVNGFSRRRKYGFFERKFSGKVVDKFWMNSAEGGASESRENRFADIGQGKKTPPYLGGGVPVRLAVIPPL